MAPKVDSTAHRASCGERESVTSRSVVHHLTHCATHVDKGMY